MSILMFGQFEEDKKAGSFITLDDGHVIFARGPSSGGGSAGGGVTVSKSTRGEEFSLLRSPSGIEVEVPNEKMIRLSALELREAIDYEDDRDIKRQMGIIAALDGFIKNPSADTLYNFDVAYYGSRMAGPRPGGRTGPPKYYQDFFNEVDI